MKKLNIDKEVATLRRMTVSQLRDRYAEVFDESTKVGNKPWLIKRIAWRLQSQVEGDISERARQRALEIANDADVRLSPPKAKAVKKPMAPSKPTPKGLPAIGTILARTYKGQTYQVQITDNGIEFEGELYNSLSAVAKSISGQHCSGHRFFGIKGEKAK